MHADGLSWSTLVWGICSPVRHLVESRVHLIHQVHVKPAEKSPVLLRVSEHLSPLHLIAHDPHNSVLQKKEKKHTQQHSLSTNRQTQNRFFSLYVTELCLFSPWFGPWRQSVSQKKQVRPSAGSSSGPGWSSPSCPRPPSQTAPCTGLRSGPPRCPPACGSPAPPAGEKHTRLRAEGEFPQCVRVSVYFFRSAGPRWKWRFRCDQLCHPEGNKKHVFRTLTSHSVGVRLAL